MPNWENMLKSLWGHRNLIFHFVIGDIRERYLGSFFGLSGYVISPLVILFVYTFIFSGILKIKFGNSGGMGNFAIYLFCGLIPWMAFGESLQRSTTILFDQRALIKRVLFPKEILPLYVILSNFFAQIIALLSFFVVLAFMGYHLGAAIMLLLIVFPFQLLFMFGCSLLSSSMNLFFRDIGAFLGTILQVWFFCTPIFYPEDLIPKSFLSVLQLNPMLHLVRIYRVTILENALPKFSSFAYFAVVSCLAFLLGFFVFKKVENKAVDYL